MASDRWLVAEVRIHIPKITKEGRDAVVEYLRATADKIASAKCDGYLFNQPERLYRMRIGR